MVGNLIVGFFYRNDRFYDRKINSIMKKDQNAPVDLLEKRSMGSRLIFLKINGIDSLKVNMVKRLTRAI